MTIVTSRVDTFFRFSNATHARDAVLGAVRKYVSWKRLDDSGLRLSERAKLDEQRGPVNHYLDIGRHTRRRWIEISVFVPQTDCSRIVCITSNSPIYTCIECPCTATLERCASKHVCDYTATRTSAPLVHCRKYGHQGMVRFKINTEPQC